MRAEVWQRLLDALGLPATPVEGEHLRTRDGVPTLAGTVIQAADWHLALLLDQPAPGTAIIAVEGHGDQMSVSVWQYLYGDDRAAIAAREEPSWWAWLSAPPP